MKTWKPALRQASQEVKSVRSDRQAELSGVVGPSLLSQSEVDWMEAQMLGVMTNWRGWKQRDVKLVGKERESSLD